MLDVKIMDFKQYDPRKVEEAVRSLWATGNVAGRCFAARRGGEVFAFLEGPPTANGFMHVGHARGRTLKDVVIRFKLMQGYDVWNRAGWDTQGLPVELETEKILGLKSKKEIERIGYEKFARECSKLVDFYLNHWRRASEVLGLWLDYDNAYETRRNEYIEFVWWALKQAYEKGLLIEDLKVIAFCPRCETPLSDQEVALGYASAEDPSIYVKCQLLDRRHCHLVIWTTTPWTLPANEAVCVHPDEYYVEVQVNDESWIIAEKRLEKVMNEINLNNYKVVGRLLGSELKGLKYVHPLIGEVPEHGSHKSAHVVVCDGEVSMEEGTGCVHIAPAHGPEDFEVGRRYSLPIFCPVDANGLYTEEAGKYKGLYVKDANKLIIRDLKAKNLLVHEGRILHEYPHCWRCNTPLIYRADKQWFLRIEPIKDAILSENERIRWVPSWAGEARFRNWIANARDWCISRLRVWGSPLNVWTCRSCGRRACVGSVEELKRMSTTSLDGLELHRPWIDSVTLKCPSCGGTMSREVHVLDCWLDSGVAHAASVNFLRDPSTFRRLFPYDFITEAVDQTRGWFFSLLFTSVMLFGKAPYKRVLCQGHVLDKSGQKMSKSRGNVVWALELMEKEGVDPLRLHLVMKAAPWDALNFDLEELKATKRLLNTIFNAFKFASTYMDLDSFTAERLPIEGVLDRLAAEDLWLLSRIQTVTDNVTRSLEALNVHEAAKAIVNFLLEDVSHGYIRYIRRRVWLESEDPEKLTAYAVLFYVLERALKLIAPFVPHFAEWVYQCFIKRVGGRTEESIFMTDWPTPDKKLIRRDLEEGAEHLATALTLVASARQKAKLKSRWPISNVVVVSFRSDVLDKLKSFQKVLREQANSRNVTLVDGPPRGFHLKLMFKGEPGEAKIKGYTSRVIEGLERMEAEEALRALCLHGKLSLKVDGESVEVDSDDVEVVDLREGSKWVFAIGKYMLVGLDASRDEELEAEAITREIVRRVQYMRKEMNLGIEDYIDLIIEVKDGSLKGLPERNLEYLKNEVRAKELEVTSKPPAQLPEWYSKDWDIEGLKLMIHVKKRC
ncbi:MAG: isoleucine--tRNA ligase [Candidatus Nezhaarchaeota archaeon]|nr:isoleucine--tRNA ligase [Candidatus Nezhaarchaeota archaeon]